MSKKQMGFTLIEIVMVLVLLGILSAVAVPKYFDLREKAENNAMAATAAEFQARLNAAFASSLLSNKSCKDAVDDGIKEANLMTSETTTAGTATQTTFTIEEFSVTAGTDDKYPASSLLTIKSTNNSTGKTFTIAIPQCE